MKSLLDIQRDVKQLEKNIQEISDAIKNVNNDIENIRNSSDKVMVDFSKIEVLAKQLKLEGHPFKRKGERKRQIYLKMLLYIVRLDTDEENIVNRLVFIQALKEEFDIELSLEDLYADCFKMDKQLYYEMAELFKTEEKEHFLVDALIVANITGEANAEICNYIADIISMLGIQSNVVMELAVVSKLVLSQSLSGISREGLKSLQKREKTFRNYIQNSITEEDGIKKLLRVVEVEVPDTKARAFKWKVKQEQKVEVGDVLAVYEKEKNNEKNTKGPVWVSYRDNNYTLVEIKATVSGTIFQFRNNNINYGVIAHEKDNKYSIKAWVKSNRR